MFSDCDLGSAGMLRSVD